LTLNIIQKIDVKSVEDFIGMSNDVNADEGILVTPHGYTKLAYYRAENDPSQILLDILTLEQLKTIKDIALFLMLEITQYYYLLLLVG